MKSEPHALIQTQKQAPLAHKPAGLTYSTGEIQEVPEAGLSSPGTRWVTPAGHLSPKTAHHRAAKPIPWYPLSSPAFGWCSVWTQKGRGSLGGTEPPGNGSVIPAQPALPSLATTPMSYTQTSPHLRVMRNETGPLGKSGCLGRQDTHA